MYFKIEPGNATYEKVKQTLAKCILYNQKAKSLAKELGFEKFGISKHHRAGGISCFESNTKPEGFVTVGKKWQNLFYPKSKNKEVIEKIKELPVMSFEEFGDAIGFKPQFKGLNYHRAYGLKQVDDFFLIEIDDNCDYTPVDGMIEILASEYKSLCK
jgi:hypothetical protein